MSTTPTPSADGPTPAPTPITDAVAKIINGERVVPASVCARLETISLESYDEIHALRLVQLQDRTELADTRNEAQTLRAKLAAAEAEIVRLDRVSMLNTTQAGNDKLGLQLACQTIAATRDQLRADLTAAQQEASSLRDLTKALREDKARLEAVRLAALKEIAIHVGAIPESHLDNGRLEHAYVLAAHRILATGEPDGRNKGAAIDVALARPNAGRTAE